MMITNSIGDREGTDELGKGIGGSYKISDKIMSANDDYEPDNMEDKNDQATEVVINEVESPDKVDINNS